MVLAGHRRSAGRHQTDRPSQARPPEVARFERFTETARSVVVSSQEQAWALGHHQTGTPHLLLALLAEDDGLLAAHGVSPETPFTPSAKQAVELSLREALRLGDRSIGSDHILLGLLRCEEGLANRLLLRLGATPAALRAQVEQRRRRSA